MNPEVVENIGGELCTVPIRTLCLMKGFLEFFFFFLKHYFI